MLPFVSHTLERMGDPDFKILNGTGESFANGVPVGFDKPLPRTPAVFPPKTKHRKLDDSEYNPWAENCSSAEEAADTLLEKFREEEAFGRMVPTTLGELKSRFPGVQPLVASMGAVTKPNGDVRPLHDATHGVQLNNKIQFQGQLQYPGPESGKHPNARTHTLFCQLILGRRTDWSKFEKRIGHYCAAGHAMIVKSFGTTELELLG